LGNLLFPWARAVVAAKKYGMRLIWPTWPQLYLSKKPKLALEYIKRHYFGYFRPTEEYISGGKKLRLLLSAKKVSEDEFFSKGPHDLRSSEDYVVVFEGMKDLFNSLMGYHETLREHLLSIVASKHLAMVKKLPWPSISVHIRFGDLPFTEDLSMMRENPWKFRLPLSWYIAQIEKLREVLGKDTPVYVFSDAQEEEIASIYKSGNVHRIRSSAIAELITMSNSFVLIASGSTYSAWASFLGQCPTIWFPNWRRNRIVLENGAECECDIVSEFPEMFKRIIVERMDVHNE